MIENVMDEKRNDEFTEEQAKLLAVCIIHSFIKALNEVRSNKDGNSDRGSIESDDES